MLPVSEKHQFLYGDREKKACTGDYELTFKPNLNKKSMEIINKKNYTMLCAGSDSNLQTDTAPNSRSVRNMHTNSKECKPDFDEMEGCTFHPKINRYVPEKSHYHY